MNSTCKVISTVFKISGCLQEKPCNLSLLSTGRLPTSVVLYVFLTPMEFIIGSFPGLRQRQVILIRIAYDNENFFKKMAQKPFKEIEEDEAQDVDKSCRGAMN